MSATPRIVILLIWAGCFAEPATHAAFRCDGENPCPDDGTVCTAGFCQPAQSLDSGGLESGTDGSSDGMTIASGCADNGGHQVGTAWACPGTFGAGKAASLCKAKWSIPADSNKVDLASCNLLGGFFVANLPGKYLPPWGTSVSCIPGNPLEMKIFFGCGAVASADYEPDSTFKCSGFSRAVNCPTATKSWDCPTTHDLASTINKVATDGVLCVFTG